MNEYIKNKRDEKKKLGIWSVNILFYFFFVLTKYVKIYKIRLMMMQIENHKYNAIGTLLFKFKNTILYNKLI